MRQLLARLAAAVLVTAAAGVATGAPAQAAACSGSTGVTVVVDFHELGGGVQQACAPDGAGKDASVLFQGVGFDLTRVQSQPGFVCRVSGLPADDPCARTPPSTAYWALWSSDGTTGSWSYASVGVDGLSVPDGGSVAFSWKQGSGASQPGVAPAARAVAPTPSAVPSAAATTRPAKKPTKAPTRTPTKTPSKRANETPTTSASTTPTVSDSATPTPTPTPTPTSTTPSASPTDPPSVTPSGSVEAASPEPTTTDPSATAGGTTPTTAPAPAEDGGLPTWVAPALVVLVFGAAGAVAVVRRRRTSG